MGGLYYTHRYEIPHQALEADEATCTPSPSLPPSSLHENLSDRTTPPNSGFQPDGTSGQETRDVPGTLVTLKALESEPNLVKNLAAISPETIEDKSKGDALSKTIPILHISWFIVQCIARALQHLPITLLEMTALAFAGLSVITYLLWWYKPLNVKYHISLDGSDSRPTPETHSPEESASPVNPSWAVRACYRLDSVWDWMGLIILGDSINGYYEDIGDGALRFYSGTEREKPKRFMLMVVVGSLFGAFHCAAWSFYFPSHTEMVLWPFSSMAVLIALFVGSARTGLWMIIEWVSPGLCLRLKSALECLLGDINIWIVNSLAFILIIPTIIMPCMPLVAIFTYIVARIMLVILAFIQLRSLPPLAFHTIQWTTYIPHI